ncbi:hypothetical protein TOPH_07981 [Tolypocladium ophioglossoides CBS 100239]|uniref:Uncharacterized protein n=1 Tax=Tolypocladium ophioglossoides (strain CBS 100239) TaxID=1163406 RepID=A0A0L0MZM4_TOLOC|nr:hypothetical protein TOPH_07981 [Tolypocladium ophioglossoides CBS 100239]
MKENDKARLSSPCLRDSKRCPNHPGGRSVLIVVVTQRWRPQCPFRMTERLSGHVLNVHSLGALQAGWWLHRACGLTWAAHWRGTCWQRQGPASCHTKPPGAFSPSARGGSGLGSLAASWQGGCQPSSPRWSAAAALAHGTLNNTPIQPSSLPTRTSTFNGWPLHGGCIYPRCTIEHGAVPCGILALLSRLETMTVVSTQQTPPPSPHQEPRHATSSSKLPHARPDEYRRVAHGNPADMTLRSDLHGSLPSAATTNGETSRFRAQGDSSPDQDASSNGADGRPSSAPGRKNGAALSAEAKDDMEHEPPKRPVKPQLQRSKSDFVPRQADDSEPEEEIREWGARHGFEDHYQSDHIISQLVNVRCAFPVHPLPPDHVLQVSRDVGGRPSTPPPVSSEAVVPLTRRTQNVHRIGSVVVGANAPPAILRMLRLETGGCSPNMAP